MKPWLSGLELSVREMSLRLIEQPVQRPDGGKKDKNPVTETILVRPSADGAHTAFFAGYNDEYAKSALLKHAWTFQERRTHPLAANNTFPRGGNGVGVRHVDNVRM